jgi:hypothetical protein
VIPTFLDLRTGRTAWGQDESLFWWTDGTCSCDCNRAIYFGLDTVRELREQTKARHPDLKPHQNYCYGTKRFVAIDVIGDLEGKTREQTLAAINAEYGK